MIFTNITKGSYTFRIFEFFVLLLSYAFTLEIVTGI